MESGHCTARELLGMDSAAGFGSPNPIAVAAETASSARATMLALAVLLGAVEQGTGRHSWRNPSGETRAYFTALQGWGYPLSPVEQLVLTPDIATVDEESTADAASGEVQHGDDADAAMAQPDTQNEPEDADPQAISETADTQLATVDGEADEVVGSQNSEEESADVA
jgi:ParB family chromosome partitioning protein